MASAHRAPRAGATYQRHVATGAGAIKPGSSTLGRRDTHSGFQSCPTPNEFFVVALTVGMPRSRVLGSGTLIILTVLHALPVLTRINVMGFAKCSYEARPAFV